MVKESILQKIMSLSDEELKDVSIYLDFLKFKDNKVSTINRFSQNKSKFKSLVGKIEIDENVINESRLASLI